MPKRKTITTIPKEITNDKQDKFNDWLERKFYVKHKTQDSIPTVNIDKIHNELRDAFISMLQKTDVSLYNTQDKRNDLLTFILNKSKQL